jgi:hypothetical protein
MGPGALHTERRPPSRLLRTRVPIALHRGPNGEVKAVQKVKYLYNGGDWSHESAPRHPVHGYALRSPCPGPHLVPKF